MAEAIDGGDILVEMYNQLVPDNNNTKNDKPHDKNKKIEYKEEINVLDRVPANLEDAKRHAKAKRVAKPIEGDVCECCGFPLQNETLNICCSTLDLSFLGAGIPLYFGFLKASMVLMVLCCLIYSTYGMITNSQGKFCINAKNGESLPPGLCYKNIFNKFSLINKINDDESVTIQNWVNLGVVIVIVIALQFYRKQMREQAETLDYNFISPSDFTVQLYNLPPKYNANDIRRLLTDWWNYQSEQTKQEIGQFQIEKINIAYDIHEYMIQINKRNSINLQIRKNNAFVAKNKGKIPPGKANEELVNERKEVQRTIDELEAQVFDGKYNKVTKHCFVTLNTRKALECLIDSQNLTSFQRATLKLRKCCGSDLPEILQLKCDGDDYFIRVKRAPEPSDVKWENCGASNSAKFCKRLITWAITIILLGACFVLIYLINQWKYHVNSENKTNQDDPVVKAELILLTLFSSFSIIFINNCLNIAIRILSNTELQSTVTTLNISIAQKLSMSQFCNSALITLVVNFTIDPDSFWGNSGITSDFTTIALINCVVNPLLNFFNPFALIRMIMRCKVRSNNDSGQYSQGEANSWYEGGPLELSIKYGSTIKNLWMIGFYTPLSPYLPIIGFVSIFFYYCMDKYLLLYRLARPSLIGSDLNLQMIEMMEYFPFSLAIGNLLWMRKIEHNRGISLLLQLIAVGISALNFIFPADKINKLLFKIKDLDDNARIGTYQDNKYNFQDEYDRSNPITKEESIKAHFKELSSKDKGKAKEYLKKMKFVNQGMNSWLEQQKSMIPMVTTAINSAFPYNNQVPYQQQPSIPGYNQNAYPQNQPNHYQKEISQQYYQPPSAQQVQQPPSGRTEVEHNLINPLLADSRLNMSSPFQAIGTNPSFNQGFNAPIFQNAGTDSFFVNPHQPPPQRYPNQVPPFQNGMMNNSQGAFYQNPQMNQYPNYQGHRGAY